MRYIYIGTGSVQISDGYGSGADDVTFSERGDAVLSVQLSTGTGPDIRFEKVRLGTVQELLAAVRQRQAQAALAEAVVMEQAN